MATAEGSGVPRRAVADRPLAHPYPRRDASDPAGGERGGAGAGRLAWIALAVVLATALGLRLWGIRQGLPYAYNADEDSHFVPRAIGMLTLGWNPHYFANPPAYTDLLRLVFAAWYSGRAGVDHAFALDPASVFTLARVCAALLGTLAVWLLYIAGARLFDRGVALVAAALAAVAFLPVFYAHLALNDVPTLAPLTLSLVGTAGVLRGGRRRDYLLAGVGLGLGCATKYTAGIVLLALAAAAAARYLEPARRGGGGRPVVIGLLLAGAAALASFLIADLYAVLDFHAFEQGIAHQSSLSGESQGKLGAPRENGIVYYLWSLTWGLGWIPSLAALGGALTIWRRERKLGWVLVPAPVIYLILMGSEGRYFGRWLLPIFPILCLLAAFFALALARACARSLARIRARRVTARATRQAEPALPAKLIPMNTQLVFAVIAALALCAQGLLYSIHSGIVLSRADTRNLARAWLVAHVPTGAKVVVEPVVPDEWVQDVGHPTLTVADGDRWVKYLSLLSRIGPRGQLLAREERAVSLENYELTLAPSLIGYYEREGYCWVVGGSQEWGRAFADPARAPLAVAYYRALARSGVVVYHVSPYRAGARPVPFGFDWSFDYYPLAYARPGPEVTVYRLRGGRCGRG